MRKRCLFPSLAREQGHSGPEQSLPCPGLVGSWIHMCTPEICLTLNFEEAATMSVLCLTQSPAQSRCSMTVG